MLSAASIFQLLLPNNREDWIKAEIGACLTFKWAVVALNHHKTCLVPFYIEHTGQTLTNTDYLILGCMKSNDFVMIIGWSNIFSPTSKDEYRVPIEYDIQAMMYPIICTYQPWCTQLFVHIKACAVEMETKHAALPGPIWSNWHNMMIQPTHNHDWIRQQWERLILSIWWR